MNHAVIRPVPLSNVQIDSHFLARSRGDAEQSERVEVGQVHCHFVARIGAGANHRGNEFRRIYGVHQYVGAQTGE
jgi:hypothetical protein